MIVSSQGQAKLHLKYPFGVFDMWGKTNIYTVRINKNLGFIRKEVAYNKLKLQLN